MKKYWHRLTPGLVKALARFYAAICDKGENDLDIHSELDKTPFAFSHVQKSNWQKLRLHGLVARVHEDGEVKKGRWLITRRGVDFLLGRVEIPCRVQSFRNRVVEHDSSSVGIKDVMGTTPYWEREFDYDIFEPTQAKLF